MTKQEEIEICYQQQQEQREDANREEDRCT